MFTDDIIRRALEEDLGRAGDITTLSIVSTQLNGQGNVIAKQDLVLAGAGVAGGVFLMLDPKVRIKQHFSDGKPVKSGAVIMEVCGNYRALLQSERIALNFLQRLCGIATLTRKFVEQVQGTKTKILDTRKTTPMLRHLEKYAVKVGGGENHRMGLFDEILIKDNHISACEGSVAKTVALARKKHPEQKITVEIAKVSQVEKAIQNGADRLLLDNMSNDEIVECVRQVNGRCEIEVSGGITVERVQVLAELAVDYISIGAITHSAPACDISFEISPI